VIYDVATEFEPVVKGFEEAREKAIGVITNRSSREVLSAPYQKEFENRVLRPLADVADAFKIYEKGVEWLINQHPEWH
jgi:hypothetical protein